MAWLKAMSLATLNETGIGVDREAGVIRGAIVAEEGIFRDRRGEFNRKGLKEIVRMMKEEPAGLKSRFTHPSLSDDGLGKFLGRSKSPRRDTVMRKKPDGTEIEAEIVRADLHFDKTALEDPIGGGKPLGVYVMDLAESDPDAIGHSLVLQVAEEYRLEKDGTPKRDEAGEVLPPLWYPTELHAVDVVDTGDATRSFLSAELDGLPDGLVREISRKAHELLGKFPRDEARTRALAWLNRWLEWEYGEEPELAKKPDPVRDPAVRRKQFEELFR